MKQAMHHNKSFHLFLIVSATAVCLSILLVVCFVLFLHVKQTPLARDIHKAIPTTPHGYVYPYPDMHMLYPVIAIAPATADCSPEYAKKPDVFSFSNLLTGHNLSYYQGSNVAAGVWEKDANLIATSIGFNLETGRVMGSTDVYISTCTHHILVSTTNFLTQSQANEMILTQTDPFIAIDPGITVNIAQIPYDQPLFVKGINGYQTEPDFALAHCNCQFGSDPQEVRVNEQTIRVDQYTIQTNRSKKYGLLYQVMYQRNNMIIAQASYLSNGTLLTFQKF